jgi:hypothetical protein
MENRTVWRKPFMQKPLAVVRQDAFGKEKVEKDAFNAI